jgi:cytochrome c peroxidase
LRGVGLFRFAPSCSPALRRRHRLENAFGHARRLSRAICLGLVLASGAATQASSETSWARGTCTNPLLEEPISAVPQPPVADPNKLALGERLFSDPRLSSSGTMACSSCHDIHANGAGSSKMDAAHDEPASQFNTLTIFNASLNFRLNWEGNFRTLADQIESALETSANLNTSVDEVVRKLNADQQTVAQFRAAYGRNPDRDSLLDALVTFEQSLVTPGSRFDSWLGGNMAALSDKELEGYRLFKSLGCAFCHQGANVGGNLMQRQGVFRELVPGKPGIVRVPSLRNVAVTPPYFHDGSVPTLEEAIRRMAAAQLDRSVSDQQVDALAAFLQTLTGTYRGVPVSEVRP